MKIGIINDVYYIFNNLQLSSSHSTHIWSPSLTSTHPRKPNDQTPLSRLPSHSHVLTHPMIVVRFFYSFASVRHIWFLRYNHRDMIRTKKFHLTPFTFLLSTLWWLLVFDPLLRLWFIQAYRDSHLYVAVMIVVLQTYQTQWWRWFWPYLWVWQIRRGLLTHHISWHLLSRGYRGIKRRGCFYSCFMYWDKLFQILIISCSSIDSISTLASKKSTNQVVYRASKSILTISFV